MNSAIILPPSSLILRFITCGSVDDGKSTLIGRLLFEKKNIFADHLKSLAVDSCRYGTQGDKMDFALLLDGLQAEREQGITIDVAYRYFSTDMRRYIVADVPGHEQYTRNMATGASTAQLAVILVDARKGVLTQTRRHSRIADMMGIRQIVLAVNKMDLTGFDQKVFRHIEEDYGHFADGCRFTSIQAIPLSALEGDNVAAVSPMMPWYTGPALLEYLDNVQLYDDNDCGSFRMPVQLVNRPNQDFRGFCGRIAAGRVCPGDEVRVLPSGVSSRVNEIVVWQDCLDKAHAGDSITLTLQDEVAVNRGDVIASMDDPPQISDQFKAQLLWMSGHPLMSGRSYLLKIHACEVVATITAVKHRIDINTGACLSAKTLEFNEIGEVNLSTNRPVVFEPYGMNRKMGGFILIDRRTFETVGAGMIDFALRRASNIHWQILEVNKHAHAALKQQMPCCIWLTGLSGSGKSTIANLLEKQLHAAGRHTCLLDGDNVRHGLNRDLGFTEADRIENIRRVAEVAKLMVEAGLIVLVSFISPFRAERSMARELFQHDEFVEVFVDTPIEECERRDVKGLYTKARKGLLKNFTGVDSPYEPPDTPDIRLQTIGRNPEECSLELSEWLEKHIFNLKQ